MLLTLSSKMLDAVNGAVIYMRNINNNQLPLHSVYGLNPIFRWLHDTIVICSKNKNT